MLNHSIRVLLFESSTKQHNFGANIAQDSRQDAPEFLSSHFQTFKNFRKTKSVGATVCCGGEVTGVATGGGRDFEEFEAIHRFQKKSLDKKEENSVTSEESETM